MGTATACPDPPTPGSRWPGIARETSTIRLGTLVTAATFRLPGPLAIAVAQVDAMSGGRVELGIGAGWYDAEHTAYGIPFPPVGERFERLEEQLAIVTGLWSTPDGVALLLRGGPLPARGQPGPAQAGAAARAADHHRRQRPEADPPAGRHLRGRVQPGLPHRRRTPRHQFDVVRAACRAADRDPADLVLRSPRWCAAAGDDAEIARRARGHRPPGGRAARPTGSAAPRRGGRQARAVRRPRRRRGPTSRSWTWPTSTTWPCWPRRCCPGWPDL